MDNEFAIVVLSCDKYADLWKPFFSLFWKNWPDCPYPVYLGSNSISFDDSRVITIFTGDDPDWSSSCKRILEQVPFDNVLVWLEDLFVIEPVDTPRFRDAVRFMKEHKARHIHLSTMPVPDIISEKGYGVYEKGRPYRVNVAGLWDKNYMTSLLIAGETPWNFEILGSYRSSYTDGFFCVIPPLLVWLNTIEKGRWLKNAMRYCRLHDVIIDDSRPVLSMGSSIFSRLKMIYFDMVSMIPWRIRLSLMASIRKLLITY